MNILEMYKKLSKEDKANLSIYCIYDSIYDVAKNEEVELDDKIVTDIQELTYNLYLDDARNLSLSQIAYFITECYIENETFLDKVKDFDYDDILEAVENDNYDFYKDEIER